MCATYAIGRLGLGLELKAPSHLDRGKNGEPATADTFQREYRSIILSIARRQTLQKPTSSRVNMMQSVCPR